MQAFILLWNKTRRQIKNLSPRLLFSYWFSNLMANKTANPKLSPTNAFIVSWDTGETHIAPIHNWGVSQEVIRPPNLLNKLLIKILIFVAQCISHNRTNIKTLQIYGFLIKKQMEVL